MTEALVYDAVRQSIEVALLVGGPILIVALVVGVVVSLVQAVTQIQEQTLTFVPKLAAVATVILVLLPWFLQKLTDFLADSIRLIPLVVS